MDISQVNAKLVLNDQYIWYTPLAVMRLRQGDVNWDEFLRVFVEDATIGATAEERVTRLLQDGNVGLATEFADRIGIGDVAKSRIESQRREWQSIYELAKADLDEYLTKYSTEIPSETKSESEATLRLAEMYVAEQSFFDAVLVLEQLQKSIDNLVQARRKQIEAAFESLNERLSRARKDFVRLSRIDFPGGEGNAKRAKELLLKAEEFLLQSDFGTVITLADWIDQLFAGHLAVVADVDRFLRDSGVSTSAKTYKSPEASPIAVPSEEQTEHPSFEREWSSEDDEYLTDNYDVLSNGQLKLRFHTTNAEIEARIEYLGLLHDRQGGKRARWFNPYVAGKPVRDKRAFVGRTDVFDFIRDALALDSDQDRDKINDRNLVALIGHRRTGKTSLLLQLRRHHRNVIEPRIPVFIDMEAMLPFKSPFLQDFFYKLSSYIQQELAFEEIVLPEPIFDDYKDPAWKFREFLRQAEQATVGHGLVLLMDEFQAIEPRMSNLDVDVYKMLRSLIQHDTNVDFILAGTMQMEQLMRDYHAALFGSALSKRIDFLDEKDARKLIVDPAREKVQYTKEAEDLIIEITACHPYFVQLVCWTLMRSLIDRGKSKVFARDIERILPIVLERGIHFDEIWATDTPDVERYIMSVLGEAVANKRGWLQTQKLEERLQALGRMPKDPNELDEAIRNLINRQILRYSEDGNAVRFQVAIFGDWVKTNKPFEVVKRDIQLEAARMTRRIERQPKNG